MPTAGGIAGSGLAFAALTIALLAALMWIEVERETDLNREVIGAQQSKEGLEALRSELHDLKYASLDLALSGNPSADQAIERHAVEIDAELGYLEARATDETALAIPLGPLAAAARTLVVQTRAIARVRRERGADAAVAQLRETEVAELAARVALERALEAQSTWINDRTLSQIRVSETLRSYIGWLLAGSIAILVALAAAFRYVQARQREALKRIEHLAHFDTLTGLPNRALLDDRLAQEMARARRDDVAFAVALFDLDGFKAVNDTHGHAAGDALLASLARRARENVRASDTFGRLGGDEFLAILPDTTREGALHVVEKLRSELSRPYAAQGQDLSVGASAGVSLFPEHGVERDALLRAADSALYDAKREGRNRTRLASDLAPAR